MPADANEVEDLEPSTDPDLDDKSQQPGAAAADDANSSDATGENSESDLLSVVRDVVSKSDAADEPASPADSEEDDDQENDEPAAKQDDEDFSDVPFHRHPRFQQLLRQSKANKRDAELYRNVSGFLDQAGLTSVEAADGLTVMGLAKTNPAEAWRQVQPWVKKLLVAAGEVLPDDLRMRVQNGEMSQGAAIEVSRSRAATQSMQAAQSFREQQAQRAQQRDTATAVRSAAETWEADRRAKDPNFDAKVEPLMKEVAYLQVKEGRPATPEGVRDQLKRAYKAVNDSLKPAPAPTPAPKPAVKPVRGGQVAGNQQPAEMSTLDIVRANRRAS